MPPHDSSLPANQEDRNRRLHKPANQKKPQCFIGMVLPSEVLYRDFRNKLSGKHEN